MEWFKTFRETQKSKRQLAIEEEARKTITVDFTYTGNSHKMYIWIYGIPVVEIPDEWSASQIIEKVSAIRANFVEKELGEGTKQPCNVAV